MLYFLLYNIVSQEIQHHMPPPLHILIGPGNALVTALVTALVMALFDLILDLFLPNNPPHFLVVF